MGLAEVARQWIVRVGRDRQTNGGSVETGRRATLSAHAWIYQGHAAMDIVHAGARIYGNIVPGRIVPQADADPSPLYEVLRNDMAPCDSTANTQVILIEELQAETWSVVT